MSNQFLTLTKSDGKKVAVGFACVATMRTDSKGMTHILFNFAWGDTNSPRTVVVKESVDGILSRLKEQELEGAA